ncbi:DUF3526 domain-containing protein [Pseudoalteromonas sp. L1]|uniref:DUF3526 domain-containing protein n=1 Tax=Pseudoalteromonas sp. L1 TaxID=195716 RepID=UPI001F31A0E9|nr:DUF3526 domain-containing protein [Pseudoalteromonas sp. L1]
MLQSTFKKEWLDTKRQGQALWLSGIAILLLLLACVTGFKSHQSYQQAVNEVSQSEQLRWLNQGEKGPHSAAHYGIYVVKPTTPLAALDDGLQAYQGNVLRLEAHIRNDSLFRSAQDNVPLSRFGSLSPAFVLQVLLPLLLILIGYPLLAREREQGTLKQLLAAGASPAKLFFAKCAVLFTLSCLFLLPVALFLLYSQTANEAPYTLRSALFLLSYLIYLLLWALITTTLSSLLPTARRALITLLTIWAFATLLLPKLAMNIATTLHPQGSGQAFQAKLESEVYTDARLDAIEKFKQQTLAQYGVSQVADLPFDYAGAQLQFGEQYADKIFDRLFEARLKQLEAQSQSYQLAGLLTPFIAVQTLSMATAATDFSHQQSFENAAEQHRRLMQEVLNFNQRDHGHKAQGHYTAGKELWQQIPEFSYQYPRFAHYLPHYVISLISFAFWLIVLVLLSLFAIKKLRLEEQR